MQSESNNSSFNLAGLAFLHFEQGQKYIKKYLEKILLNAERAASQLPLHTIALKCCDLSLSLSAALRQQRKLNADKALSPVRMPAEALTIPTQIRVPGTYVWHRRHDHCLVGTSHGMHHLGQYTISRRVSYFALVTGMICFPKLLESCKLSRHTSCPIIAGGKNTTRCGAGA